MALLYLAAILVVLIARHILAERYWWSTLLLYAPPICYLLPLPLFMVPAILQRDVLAMRIHLTSLLLILGPVMGAVAQNPLDRAPTVGKRVRMLSYNIHGGLQGFHRVAAHMRHFRPDVVVFSEARPLRTLTTLPKDLRTPLEGWDIAFGDDVFIASRWPIVDREVTPLGFGSGRSRVRASVHSSHDDFHVIGVHYYTHGLSPQQAVKASFPAVMEDSAEARLRQTRDLLTAARKLEGPVLVAGDFNNPPAGHAYRMLREHFEDSHRRIGWGWGYTFPSDLPVWRIDYIFSSPEWSVVRVEVGGAEGSDHRPLFAEFSLK